jgi:hypothetical protein
MAPALAKEAFMSAELIARVVFKSATPPRIDAVTRERVFWGERFASRLAPRLLISISVGRR